MSTEKSTGGYEAGAYVAQLEDARRRLVATGRQVLDWLSHLDESAESEFIHLEPMLDLFPCQKGADKYRLIFEIIRSSKRYGTLGVMLRTDSMRTDLSCVTATEFTELIVPFSGVRAGREHAIAFQRLVRFNERVSALKFLGVEFDDVALRGPVLPRWFDALRVYGQKCRPLLETRLVEFLALSASLDEAMFEFNSSMGKVRYRSIRCTYTLDEFDLLGPSEPGLKVVTSLNPITRSRRYNRMTDFKKALKKKQIAKNLRRELGRDPSKTEVEHALGCLGRRKETDWITTRVIKACHLGRVVNEVLESQRNLVAVIQPWTALRSQLQALLP